MEKQSLCKLFVGKWNTVTLVSVAVGAALFGVLMVFASIPVFTNTMLTAAMIIPVIVGALFGPLAAFIACGLGNIIADMIGGWGIWFDWSVGNAFLGLFVGTLPLYGARIRDGIFTVKHAIIYAVVCVVGVAISMGIIIPIMTAIFYAADLEITMIQALVGGIANIGVLLIVGIPLLFLLANRFSKRSNLKEED